jgi:hypothetical protein
MVMGCHIFSLNLSSVSGLLISSTLTHNTASLSGEAVNLKRLCTLHCRSSISSRPNSSKDEMISCGSPTRSCQTRGGYWSGREVALEQHQSGGKLQNGGPSLFSEVFALGSSIAFRWAKVKVYPN